MNSARATLFGLTIALVLLVAAPSTATHDGFHQYSKADEHSLGYTYRGVRLYREDMNPGGVPSDGCSNPYSGHPVYQTQWIVLNSSASSWVEGGTGHQCAGSYRYRFWGYGWNGSWYPQGSQQTTETYVRRLRSLFRNNNGDWSYVVGSTALGSNFVNWSVEGVAAAGLESYASGAAVGGHAYDTLQYYRGGSWSNWAGFDGNSVGSQMCGRWWTATEWRAAQNRSC